MPVWQIVLEYVKVGVAPIGALLGVFVGIYATRGQKSREAMQGLKKSNYEEVKKYYQELSSLLVSIEASARSVIASARVVRLGQQHSASTEGLSVMLDSLHGHYKEFEANLNKLDSVVGNLFIHRSETDFHAAVTSVKNYSVFVDVMLMTLDIGEVSEDSLSTAEERVERFATLVFSVRHHWDSWKVQAEREAAGLRPLSERQLGKTITSKQL